MTKPTELEKNVVQRAHHNSHNGITVGMARLEDALKSGPSGLREQIRFVVMLSQLNGSQSGNSPLDDTQSYHEPDLTIRQARLRALAYLADKFDEEQIRNLLKDITQISDPAIRLPLMIRFALRLPPTAYRGMTREVWGQAKQITDPVIHARVLFDLAPLLALVNDEPGTPSPLLQVIGLAQKIKNTEGRIRSLIALAPYLPVDYSLRVFRRVLTELYASQNDSLVSKSLATLAPHLPGELVDEVLRVAHTVKKAIERARAITTLARYMDGATISHLHEQALQAIDSIEDENDRAEALIAFAPNLEHAKEGSNYPVLLEKALTSIIMLTRRNLRAQVLVALAPHLTADLQGEALAAVHSLESERDRANLLAKLAPNLPSDMLVASLAVAHTMRERDCRVQALTTLAQYVPESARQQTTMDALATASNLPKLYERVQALVGLINILPANMVDQAWQTALKAASEIENAHARARALNLIGDKLPAALMPRALEIANELENPEQRLNALLGMLDNLTEKQRARVYDKLVASAGEMPLEYKRARALISLAPHFPADRLGQIEELASNFNDPIDQVNVYIAIVHNLPPDERPRVIKKAAERIRRIDEGYDRASATAALVPFLPKSERAKLPKTVYKTILSVADEYDRASVIALLAPLLAGEGDQDEALIPPDALTALQDGLETALTVSHPQLRSELLAQGIGLWITNANSERTFELWNRLAKKLISLPMTDVLLCLGALAPLFHEIGGEETVKDIAHLLGLR